MSWIPEKYSHLIGTHCWFCDREYSKSKSVFKSNGNPLKKTREHIIPKSRVIYNIPTNYIGTCADCNTLKAKRDAIEFATHIEHLILIKSTTGHSMSKLFETMRRRAWKLYNKTSFLHKNYQRIRL
jgi:hypothetical protein